MSGLFTRDLPSALERLESAAYAVCMVAKHAASDTPESTYSLAGRLVVTPSNWGMLLIPNSVVRGIHAALCEPGVELPLKDGNLRAHLTVFRPEDIDKIGGAEKITERGKHFRFQLGPLKVVKPRGWDDVSAAFIVHCESPELKRLRCTYGLTPLPNGNHPFHITIGVRRTGVLHHNDKSKAASARAPLAPAILATMGRPQAKRRPRAIVAAPAAMTDIEAASAVELADSMRRRRPKAPQPQEDKAAP